MRKTIDKNGITAETPTRPKKAPRVFYVAMALLPLLFFVLLETSLRIAGDGPDTGQWKTIGSKYTLNPDVGLRYFSNIRISPSAIEDDFDIAKKENCYRVFVLGGSSAAGFPYEPMGSFSRYIRKRLEMNYPARTIEVVNIAMSAVNSYTLLDLIPGVIEQAPDVILIYAGHNEYYGALGVGSMESMGGSRMLIHAVLRLNRLAIVQRMRDFLNRMGVRSTKDGQRRTATLMARMAEKSAIEYQSPLFYKGIEQFAGNLRAIINICKKAGVPLVLGTITSNLKDQKPFTSIESDRYPTAMEVFEKARSALNNGDYEQAHSLFARAKDLDGLRFRAPTEINETILALGEAFGVPVVDIDGAFRSAAGAAGVVGNEWITDHLHPTIDGYQLMGKVYYDGLRDAGLLPDGPPAHPYEEQHALAVENFVITDLDRRIGAFRILKLKNDWPFVRPDQKKRLREIIRADTLLDRLSLQVADNEKKWVVAHTEMASAALGRRDMDGFLRHMDVMIYQYPATEESYDLVIRELLKAGMRFQALPYLQQRYRLGRNAYLAKWIGIILLAEGDGQNALPYLEESISLYPDDPQVFYNLCGAHLVANRFADAEQALKKCLDIDPDFPGARQLLQRIKARS